MARRSSAPMARASHPCSRPSPGSFRAGGPCEIDGQALDRLPPAATGPAARHGRSIADHSRRHLGRRIRPARPHALTSAHSDGSRRAIWNGFTPRSAISTSPASPTAMCRRCQAVSASGCYSPAPSSKTPRCCYSMSRPRRSTSAISKMSRTRRSSAARAGHHRHRHVARSHPGQSLPRPARHARRRPVVAEGTPVEVLTERHLARFYGASVSVLCTADGLAILPRRPSQEPRHD